MTPKINFETPQPFWPSANFLTEKNRERKLKKIKLLFNKQLNDFKNAVENTDRTHIDKIEIFKENRSKVNDLIKKYNSLTPTHKHLCLIPNIDFITWKQQATFVLIEDILNNVASLMPCKDLPDWLLVCKATYQYVQKSQFSIQRLKLGKLDEYLSLKMEMKEKNKPIFIVVDEYTKDQYLAFEKTLQELNNLEKAGKLAEKDIVEISSDLMHVANKNKDLILRIFFLIRIYGLLKIKKEDPTIEKVVNFAQANSIVFSKSEADKILDNQNENALKVFEESYYAIIFNTELAKPLSRSENLLF